MAPPAWRARKRRKLPPGSANGGSGRRDVAGLPGVDVGLHQDGQERLAILQATAAQITRATMQISRRAQLGEMIPGSSAGRRSPEPVRPPERRHRPCPCRHRRRSPRPRRLAALGSAGGSAGGSADGVGASAGLLGLERSQVGAGAVGIVPLSGYSVSGAAITAGTRSVSMVGAERRGPARAGRPGVDGLDHVATTASYRLDVLAQTSSWDLVDPALLAQSVVMPQLAIPWPRLRKMVARAGRRPRAARSPA